MFIDINVCKHFFKYTHVYALFIVLTIARERVIEHLCDKPKIMPWVSVEEMLSCKLFYDSQSCLQIPCSKSSGTCPIKQKYSKYSSLYNEYVLANMLKISRQAVHLLCAKLFHIKVALLTSIQTEKSPWKSSRMLFLR